MNEVTLLPPRVLLVGPAELLSEPSRVLRGQAWFHTAVHSPRDASRYLREDRAIDLVVMVPGEALSAYTELCRSIKFDARSSFVSVIVLLAGQDSGQGEEVLASGADDCIGARASEREIVLRLLKAIRLKQATDSLEDAAAVITSLANAVEGKDHYTCGHVERVASYAMAIGRLVGVDAEGLAALKTGGVVHDIGKIGIPDEILNKPGKLGDAEMAIMKRHPVIGYDILKELRTFRNVLPIVRWHHERPNGTGYPDGLKGDALPVLPRIAAVADVFDALSTDRPYRPGFPLPKCRDILRQSAEAGELDKNLVQALMEILDTGMLASKQAAA